MPEEAPPTAWMSAQAKRLIAWTVALLSGAFMLGLTILTAALAAVGRPISPSATLVVIACFAMMAFIISGFAVMRYGHERAEAAEQETRDLRRAEERRRYSGGLPPGLKVGQLERWAFEARTPDLLDEESTKLLAEMIDHCIAGLNQDTIYIIQCERFSSSFGPIEGRRGRYRRRLTWTDAQAEITRLQNRGMVEPVGEGPPGRFRWTPFGLAVIGKLGPRLDWWRPP